VKYAESGVDIDAARRALARAHRSVRSTWDDRVLGEVGGFGGLYRPAPGEPLLVASIDGVGTKVKLAALAGCYESVGQDIVNHCVDDILVQGAEPLFFLDYFGTGNLDEAVLPQVLAGLASACRENGCALLGGETAEMPGVYGSGDFDLVGCIVGRVAEAELIDGSAIAAGDRIWGLPSTGLHTNGYTLARKVLLEQAGFTLAATPPGLGSTLGEALLAVHRSYLSAVRRIWASCGRPALHGLAHITGGGFHDNVPRVMPEGLTAVVDTRSWQPLPIFDLIARHGDVETAEMYRVFNMGIGMLAFLPPEIDAGALSGTGALPVGEVRAGECGVEVVL
jgi:phosphoribosylformylglycinamidine cyclo-ligase